MGLRDVLGSLTGRLRGHAPEPGRRDAGSLPPGRYVFAVESIPVTYAGRTSSILNKIRLFAARPGVSCCVLVFGFPADLPAVAAEIRRRGVAPGTELRSLYALLDPAGDLREGGTHLTREVGDGMIEVDELDAAGTLRLRVRVRVGESRPLSETFWRADGSVAFVRTRGPAPDDPAKIVDSVIAHDADGSPQRAVPWNRFVHSLLDRLVAESEDPVVLSVEARTLDRMTLTWRNTRIRKVYVLHNPHLLPPFDDVARVRGGFEPVLRRRDEVDTVFLTEGQRAAAVAEYGPSPRWWVIPHAARPIRPVPQRRDPDLVVMVGRLHPQKRIDLAINAMPHLLRTRPRARLVIYGEGPLEGELRQQIDGLGLQESVTLAGYTTEVDAVYGRAAVSLLTSEYEGLGLVLVESLLNGCPVVACDVPYGPGDIIDDGGNGLLCAGTPEAVARALATMLGDQPLRERLSAAGPLIAERYSESTFLQRWAELLNSARVQD